MDLFSLEDGELFIYNSPARGEQLFILNSISNDGPTGEATLIAEKDGNKFKAVPFQKTSFNPYAPVRRPEL